MFGERALLALDGFFLRYAQDPNLALWPTFEGGNARAPAGLQEWCEISG